MKSETYCCPECFSDIFLKEHIKANKSKTGKCTFCGISKQPLIKPQELSALFEHFLDIYSQDTHGEKLNIILQNDWQVFAIQEEILQMKLLKAILGKNIFANRNCYCCSGVVNNHVF